MLVTDEQENIGVDRSILINNPMIVVNPTPYPSHLPRFSQQFIYAPARNAETLGAAYRLAQILSVASKTISFRS